MKKRNSLAMLESEREKMMAKKIFGLSVSFCFAYHIGDIYLPSV
jgi:hypothetical protein